MSRRNAASTRAFLTDVLGLAHDVASDLTQFLLQADIYDPQVSGVYIVFGKTLGAESDWFRMIETVWGVPISEEATYALIFEDKPTGALLVRRSLRLAWLLAKWRTDRPTDRRDLLPRLLELLCITIPKNLFSVWKPIVVATAPTHYLGFLAFVDATEKLSFRSTQHTDTSPLPEPPSYFDRDDQKVQMDKLLAKMHDLGFDLRHDLHSLTDLWVYHEHNNLATLQDMLGSTTTVKAPKCSSTADPGAFMRDVLHVAVVLQIVYGLNVVRLVEALPDTTREVVVSFVKDPTFQFVYPWFPTVRIVS